jgi:hypothetical protein
LDGAELGVCKGAVAERQIHLEGMRGGFPIEAGFFQMGALSAFKGVMLDGGFKCFKRGIDFEGYFVAMVHFYCLLLVGSVLIGSHLGKWLRVRALNGEIKGFIVLAIDVRQKLNIPVIVAGNKTGYA